MFEIDRELDEKKRQLKRYTYALSAFAFVMLAVAAVGTVTILIPGVGCYTSNNKCLPKFSNDTHEIRCTGTPKWNCSEAFQTCGFIGSTSSGKEYEGSCREKIAQKKYSAGSFDIPVLDCMILSDISLVLSTNPGYYYSTLYSVLSFGILLASFVNAICVCFGRPGSCPVCSFTAAFLMLVVAIIFLFGCTQFSQQFDYCFSVPTTWIVSMIFGFIGVILAVGEGITACRMDMKELEVINCRRKMRGKQQISRNPVELCCLRKLEEDKSDAITIRPPIKITETAYIGTNVKPTKVEEESMVTSPGKLGKKEKLDGVAEKAEKGKKGKKPKKDKSPPEQSQTSLMKPSESDLDRRMNN